MRACDPPEPAAKKWWYHPLSGCGCSGRDRISRPALLPKKPADKTLGKRMRNHGTDSQRACFCTAGNRLWNGWKKPAQTLGCISRYLCYEGYEKPQIEETLHRFMRENYANYHAVQWSAAIEHISSRADRRPLLQANQIEITQEELASIRALASQPLERLCFTLLCLAKYAQLINPANDGWVTQKWSAIFRMAHVQAGKERQAAMLHTLREKG